ncbi:MAG TPA: TonB-dependent receptor [Candidatus Deferrimicrobium sp.]|nr:TonB-dependent receptor [Candidatus Deferrimicrobium sp.]
MRLQVDTLIVLAVLSFAASESVRCQTASDTSAPRGSIHGRVVDIVTKSPVVGASISFVGTLRGAATDQRGEFTLLRLPVGNYSLAVRSIGYEPLTKTDVIVRSKRITYVEAELRQAAVEVEGTVVTAGYFPESPSQPTGVTGFTSEEIRRSPGSAGDVSRIIRILPSAAKINDLYNGLVIRGGSPAENGFYLDNIEIPNINHYPIQGSTGGPIGLLNVDFLQEVTFSSGGFSAIYGDRLSSIMDLTFREGNRREFDGQLDANFAGFGTAAEAPIGSGRGSWLFAARRSFLDLLVDVIGLGVVPRYSDYQGKLVYDVSAQNKVTILGVLGIDLIEFERAESLRNGNSTYGRWDGHEWVVGADWRCLWSANGYSNTSFSILSTRYKSRFYSTESDRQLTDENSLEQTVQIRNVSAYQFNRSTYFEFGLDGKYVTDNYDFSIVEYTNNFGDGVSALAVDERIRSPKVGTFVSLTMKPFKRLTTTAGLRYDFFEYNKLSHLSPRISWSYQLSRRCTLNGASGIYYQNLPLHLLVQRKTSEHLKDLIAYHYIIGASFLLKEDTKLTVEGYFKDYYNFPIDLSQPQLFAVDEAFGDQYFTTWQELVDVGRARSRGVELTLQKKLVRGVYGMVCGSYSKSRYRGLGEVWRDRVIDNRAVVGIEGGYKPNNHWEFSMRWIFAGGIPYTPLNLRASRILNRTVLDRTRVNLARYPDYHALNLRVDRRFHFRSSNLILYLSVWNAYNRKNIFTYFWNTTELKQDAVYQWSRIPLLGVEFEF